MIARTADRGATVPTGLPRGLKSADEAVGLFEGVDYQEYWVDPTRRYQEALENHLVARALPESGERIVDIGCGYGRLGPLYLGRFRSAVMLDGSLSLLREAKGRYGDAATLVAGDVRRLPFKDGAFDCALSIRVLQHLQDPSGAIGEAARVLTGGGTYIASFHNKRNARRIAHFLTRRHIPSPFGRDSVEVSPALVSHDPGRFDGWMRGAGFDSVRYDGALVVGPIARVTERLRHGVPSGAGWARASAVLGLAPWLIGSATAPDSHDDTEASRADDLFCCPVCRHNLRTAGEALACDACERTYPIVDGIFDLRP